MNKKKDLQKSRIWKCKTNENLLEKRIMNSPKGKRSNVLTMVVWDILLLTVHARYIRNSMHATWNSTASGDGDSTNSEDDKYE